MVVTLNRFVTDTEAELDFIKHFCEERDCDFALSEVWEKGGDGGIELGKAVLRTLETKKASTARCILTRILPLKRRLRRSPQRFMVRTM